MSGSINLRLVATDFRLIPQKVLQRGSRKSRVAATYFTVMKIDMPLPLSSADVSHRQQFEQFALDHAELWHREHLGKMDQIWNQWNEKFFGWMMLGPLYCPLVPFLGTRLR